MRDKYKVYSQDELREENILTLEYVLNLMPGDFPAVLDLKADGRGCLRTFFTFEDGRKILATPQWWQKYLGFHDIPVGSRLLLHYTRNSHKEVYHTAVDML